MSKYAQGRFQLQHPEKYVGKNVPKYRSSWEFAVMSMCDNHPSIIQWANEAIHISYRNPFTGKNTIYVPDFFIQYVDAKSRILVELIEIKPASQSILERVGKNKYNQAQYIKNQAKWAAANLWCKQQGIRFRILNENDLFQM